MAALEWRVVVLRGLAHLAFGLVVRFTDIRQRCDYLLLIFFDF